MSAGSARRASALFLAGWLAAAGVVAAPLYKWVDEQGKTQYSDRPPKNFKGEVTRVEADVEGTTVPAHRRAPPPAQAPAAEETLPDLNARRKAQRERLELRLERARANLERAKKALAEAPGPDIDERQVIQQRAGASVAATARSNCREVVDAGGRKVVLCPTVMPGDAYYERIAGLEAAVKRAEAELEEAEIAYRRGRD